MISAFLLIGVLLLVMSSCGGSTTGLEDDGTPDVVAALEVEQGAQQSARPERVMPDSVVGRAMDDAGNPIEGQLVNFEVPGGAEAGAFDVGSLVTNAQGRVFNELRAGTRAWTARVRAGEDSAYTARLIASRDGRPDEILEFTFAVQPGEPVELADFRFGGGGPRVLDASIGDPIDVLDVVPWPARDQWDNPIPAEVMRSFSATWQFAHHNNDVGAVDEPAGTGWTTDAVPELHRLGWHPSELRDTDTTTAGFDTAVEQLPDSLETRGELVVEVQNFDGAGTNAGTSSLTLEVLLPVCWETEPQGDEDIQRFVTIPWSNPCPAVEPS